ncbi:MAG: InlB B-repeat-containing protein [Oscillospiraceae bacterium]|nr:InlB B-repeat-containing protein [Oscillospiraceae bacterium]
MLKAKRGLCLLLATLMLSSVFAVPGLAGITAEPDLKAGSATGAAFRVPETIYLEPGGTRFQYFVDSDRNGALNRSRNQRSGTVVFDCPGASNVRLDASMLSGGEKDMGANSVSIRALHPSTNVTRMVTSGGTAIYTTGLGSLFELTLTDDGGVNSSSWDAPEQHSLQMIEWVVTYDLQVEVDNIMEIQQHKAYAYTVIYAPYYGEAGQAGLLRTTNLRIGFSDFIESYFYLTGLHRVSGGDYERKFDDNHLSALMAADTNGKVPHHYLTKTTSSYVKDNLAQWTNEKTDGGLDIWTEDGGGDWKINVNPKARGHITVDTRRYTNLYQIPNLSTGWTLFWMDYATAYARLETLAESIDDYETGSYPNLVSDFWVGAAGFSPITTQAHNVDQGSWAFGLYPLQGSVKQGNAILQTFHHLARSMPIVPDFDLWTFQRVNFSVDTVSKASLRSAVNSASSYLWNQTNTELIKSFDGTTGDTRAKIRAAALALGDPEAPATQINPAVTQLNDSMQNSRDCVEAPVSFLPRIINSKGVGAPEAVYLRPGENDIYHVVSYDPTDTDPTKLTGDPGKFHQGGGNDSSNAGTAQLMFKLPDEISTSEILATRQVKYETVDKNGIPTPAGATVNDVRVGSQGNTKYLTYGEFTDWPAQDTGGGSRDASLHERYVVFWAGELLEPSTGQRAEGGIRWTFRFKHDGIWYESYAVTWVHPTPIVEAGVAGLSSINVQYDGTAVYTYITGVHRVSGGNSRSGFVNGFDNSNGTSSAANVNSANGGHNRRGNMLRWTYDSANRTPSGGPMSEDWFDESDYNAFVSAGNWFPSQADGGVSRLREHSMVTATGDGRVVSQWFFDRERKYGEKIHADDDGAAINMGVPTAHLAIDISRYGGQAFNRIPFLSSGAMRAASFNNYSSQDNYIHQNMTIRRSATEVPGFSDPFNYDTGNWNATYSYPSWATPIFTLDFIADGHQQQILNWGDSKSRRAELMPPLNTDISGTDAPGRFSKIPTQSDLNSYNLLDSGTRTRTYTNEIAEYKIRRPSLAINPGPNGYRLSSRIYVDIKVDLINKAALRSNLQNAQSVFRPIDLYKTDEYEAYRDVIFQAGEELGRVATPAGVSSNAWQTQIDSLANELALKNEANMDASLTHSYLNIDGKPIGFTESNRTPTTFTAEPLAAWRHLYKHKDETDTDTPTTESIFESRSYARHYKRSNGEPFYAESIGYFEELSPARYEDLFGESGPGTDGIWGTEDDVGPRPFAQAATCDPTGTDTKVYFAPGTGTAYFPDEYYIETLADGGEVLHPLVKPVITYLNPFDSDNEITVYAMPDPAPPSAPGTPYTAWVRQWQAFTQAYGGEYPEGSYIIKKNAILPLEIPDEITIFYPNGSKVTALPVATPGHFFDYDNIMANPLPDIVRHGPDTDRSRYAYAAESGLTDPLSWNNVIIENNGLGNFSADCAHEEIVVDSAAAKGSKTNLWNESPQDPVSALVYPITFGRLQYDLYYEPSVVEVRYTNEAGDEDYDDWDDPDDEIYYVNYYATYTVTAEEFPEEDVPDGKYFLGWRFSGDQRIYNNDASSRGFGKFPTSFVWLTESGAYFSPVFADITTDLTIDGNGGTFNVHDTAGSVGLWWVDEADDDTEKGGWFKDGVFFNDPETMLDPALITPADESSAMGYEKLQTTQVPTLMEPSVKKVEANPRPGYDFIGWEIVETESTAYIAGTNSSIMTWVPGKTSAVPPGDRAEIVFGDLNTTVRARWNPLKYRIEYYEPDGTTLLLDDFAVYDSPYTLATQAQLPGGWLPPTGKRFVGWEIIPASGMPTLNTAYVEGVLRDKNDPEDPEAVTALGQYADALIYADKSALLLNEYAPGALLECDMDESAAFQMTYDSHMGSAIKFRAVYDDLSIGILYSGGEANGKNGNFTVPKSAAEPGQSLDLETIPHLDAPLYDSQGMLLQTQARSVFNITPTHPDGYAFLGYKMILERETAAGTGVYVDAVPAAEYGPPYLQAGQPFWDGNFASTLNHLGLTPAMFEQSSDGTSAKYRIRLEAQWDDVSTVYTFDLLFDPDLTVANLEWNLSGWTPAGLDAGTGGTQYIRDAFVGQKILMPPEPATKEPGKVFAGWYIYDAKDKNPPNAAYADGDMELMSAPSGTFTVNWLPVSDTVTFVARWEMATDIKIRYNPNGGTQKPPFPATTYSTAPWTDPVNTFDYSDTSYPLRSSIDHEEELHVKRAGYSFAGWAVWDPEEGEEGAYVAITTDPYTTLPYLGDGATKTLDVYAQWTPIPPETGGTILPPAAGSAKLVYHLQSPTAVFPAGKLPSHNFAAQEYEAVLWNPYASTNPTGPQYWVSVQADANLGGLYVTGENAPIWAGYEFVGWFEEPAGDTAVNSAWPMTPQDPESTYVNIYAKWAAIAPDPDYPGLGEGGDQRETAGSAKLIYHLQGRVAEFPSTALPSHIFDGDTFTAKLLQAWTGDDVTSPTYSIPVLAGSAIGGLEAATPVWHGYVFDGWYADANCETAQLTGAWIMDPADPLSTFVKIYAKWVPATGSDRLTVQYFPMYGTPQPPNWTPVTAGTVFGANLPAVTRAGYYDNTDGPSDGKIWYTAETGGYEITTSSLVQQTVPANEKTVKLYKQWTAIPAGTPGCAQVFFHPTASETEGPFDATAGSTTYYSLFNGESWYEPTRAGYSFKGWQVGVRSEGVWVADTDPSTNTNPPLLKTGANYTTETVALPCADSAEVHLYGVWCETSAVTLTRNTRCDLPMDPPQFTGLSASTTLESLDSGEGLGVPLRAGYDFKGWSTTNPGEGVLGGTADVATYNGTSLSYEMTKIDDLLAAQNTTALNVYALWTQTTEGENQTKKIRLTFDTDGGTLITAGSAGASLLENGYVDVFAGTVLGVQPTVARGGYVWDLVWYAKDSGGSFTVPFDFTSTAIQADNLADTSANPLKTVKAVWTVTAGSEGKTDIYWHGGLPEPSGYFGAPDANPLKTMHAWAGATAGLPLNEQEDFFPEELYPGEDGLPLPIRHGYIFNGWVRASESTFLPVNPGTVVNPETVIENEALKEPSVMNLYATWVPVNGGPGGEDPDPQNAVRLKFDLKGGVLASDGVTPNITDIYNVTAERDYGDYFSFATYDLVKAGYTFDGWYQESDPQNPGWSKALSNTTAIVPDATAPKDADGGYIIWLVAKWSQPSGTGNENVRVTWNPGDGLGSVPPQQDMYFAGQFFTGTAAGNPAYLRPGFRLAWWVSDDLVTEADQWKANIYPSDLITGIEKVNPKPGILPIDDIYNVSMVAGWQAIDPDKENDDGEKAKAVHVNFDVNGGTAITPASAARKAVKAYETGDVAPVGTFGNYFSLGIDATTNPLTAMSITPFTKRGGYRFLGWFQQLENSTALQSLKKEDNDQIHPYLSTNELTLVARWQAIAPTTQDPEEYDGSLVLHYVTAPGTAVPSVHVEAGTPYTTALLDGAAAASRRPGYVPDPAGCWFLSYNSETKAYADPVAVNDDIETVNPGDEEITLYLKWVPDASIEHVTLAFDARGGTAVTEGNPRAVTLGSGYGELPATNRDGYSFLGWYTNLQVDSESGEPAGVLAGAGVPVEPIDFEPDGLAEKENSIELTLFAFWAPLDFGITVQFAKTPYGDSVTMDYSEMKVSAGGKYIENHIPPYGETDKNQPLPKAYLEDYSFDGWFLVEHSRGDEHPIRITEQAALVPVDENTKVDMDDVDVDEETGLLSVTLYPHFTPLSQSVQIKLYPNGAGAYLLLPEDTVKHNEVTMSHTNEAYYYTENELKATPLLKDVTAEREGYSFAGWYADQAGAQALAESKKILNLEAETPTKVTTGSSRALYAGWIPMTYTVSFSSEVNGSPVGAPPPAITVEFGSAYGTDPITRLARTLAPPTGIDGFDFLGWFDAEGNEVLAEDTVATAGNHVLHARLQPRQVAGIVVIFDPQGGTVTPDHKSVTYQEPYGVLPTPERKGYVFQGWFTEPEGDTQVTAETLVSRQDHHILYAQWKRQTTLPLIIPAPIPVVVPVIVATGTGAGALCGICGIRGGCGCGKATPPPSSTQPSAPAKPGKGLFPNTGDASTAAALAMFALMSAAAAAWLVGGRKKDEEA